MANDHPEESWEAWVGRVASELAALADEGFATYAARPNTRPHDGTDTTATIRKRWRLGRPFRMPSTSGPSTASAPATAEVLLQVRLLEGWLALECIGDTEFEGLSDLSAAQQSQLVALGWEQDAQDPTFSKTYSRGESGAAAGLIARSLREVLGADRPSQVDTRHA